MTLLASVPLFANRDTDIALQQNLHAPGSLVSRNLEIIYPSRAMTTNIYDQTNDYVSTSIVQTLGSALVPSAPLRGGETGSLVLSLSGEAHTPQQPLGSTVLWFSSSMNSTHLRLLQGRFPSSHLLGITSTPRGVAYDIEAIVAPEWAAQFHLKLNAVVEVADADALDLHLNFKPFLRVHIVGFFQPKSLQDPAWFDDLDPFTPPSGFNDALPPMPIWVNQTTFTERIPLIFPNANFSYLWFFYLRLDAITPENAATVAANLDSLIAYEFPTQHDAVFTGLPLLLKDFLQQLVFVQTVTLVVILPGVVFLLLYLFIIASALLEQSREELALMQSRGASHWQVLTLSLGEALLLCLGALLLAPFLAEPITTVLIQLSSSDAASGQRSLSLVLPSLQSYLYAAGAATLCFMTILLPSLSALRANPPTIKRWTSRPHLSSLPLRLGPGLLLTALGLFGYLEIQQRGAFFLQNLQGASSVDWVAASTPTLLLVGAAGLSLLLLPPTLVLLDHLAQRLPGIAASLASRALARRSGRYSRLVFLLTLTISLDVFSALCYGTLGGSLDDRAAFLAGTDLRLVEGSASLPDLERQAAPLEDHLHLLPGVTDGMNVLRAQTTLSYASSTAGVTLLAIDNTRFARVAFWRSDFADVSLGTLLQAIRSAPLQEGTLPAIVSDQLLSQTNLHIGDHLLINLQTSQRALFPFRIVGTFHYFPTVPGQYGIVCDLNRLLSLLNQNSSAPVTPNEVWLKLTPNAPEYTATQVEQTLFSNPEHQQVVVTVQQAYNRVALAESLRAEPLQMILFGTFILDFLIAALLSVAGLGVLISLLARQRTVEFGVLRAMGLSLHQLAGALGWEETTLFLCALLLGAPLGTTIAALTLPAFSFSDTGQPLIPPIVLRLNVQQLLQEGLTLCACLMTALLVTALLFRRLRVHEVLRLGEE